MNETPPPPPTLHESILDAAALHALLEEIETRDELIELRVKGVATHHSASAQVSFAEAEVKLVAGNVFALQIRYRHEGEERCDTILAQAGSYKLVRVVM